MRQSTVGPADMAGDGGGSSEALPRQIMRIELREDSKRRLESYCLEKGKKQVATLSRLVEFFADQPEEIQALIQGDLPEAITGDVARLILKRMAGRGK